MTWTRLPDTFTDDPAVLDLPLSARWAHIEGLVYCNRHLLDGAVKRSHLRRIVSTDDPKADVAALIDAGLWTETADGWQIGWTDQEPADRVTQRQEYRRERNRAFRDRQDRHARGDHSACLPGRCPKSRDASRDSSPEASRTASRPVPSRSVPSEGQGTGSGVGPAQRSAPPASPQGRDNATSLETPDPTDYKHRHENRPGPAAPDHAFAPDTDSPDVCRCGLPRANSRHYREPTNPQEHRA